VKPTVAFDVDGTLIGPGDVPRDDVLRLLYALEPFTTIIVWSGGGKAYAELWGRRLMLPSTVRYMGKTDGTVVPDIAVDDQELKDMAKVVINV
jgi:hypothetical protein